MLFICFSTFTYINSQIQTICSFCISIYLPSHGQQRSGSGSLVALVCILGSLTSTGLFTCIRIHFYLALYLTSVFLGEDVAVLNSATVKDLKLAIKKKTNDMEQLQMGHRHISWYDYSIYLLLLYPDSRFYVVSVIKYPSIHFDC